MNCDQSNDILLEFFLFQTVKGVADATPLLENGSDEMLLLHLSYSPRR